MPGANCSIYGCSTSRKKKGIAIFRVPTGDDEFNTKWRENIVSIITKDRIIDKSLKCQIENRNLYTCELHYPEEQLVRNESRTTRIPGSLPSLHLPAKCHPTTSFPERSTSSIEKRVKFNEISRAVYKPCYQSFQDFNKRILTLKLSMGWEIMNKTNFTQAIYYDEEHTIPKYEINVSNDLTFNIRVYNWLLSKDHAIIKNVNGSMKNTTLTNLISLILSTHVCVGVTTHKSESLTLHIVPQKYTPSSFSLLQTEFWRSSNCSILTESSKCKVCLCNEKRKETVLIRQKERSVVPAKNNAPVSLTSPDRIKLTLKIIELKINNWNLKLKHYRKNLTNVLFRLVKLSMGT